jgi:hypothetical protein
MVYTREAHPSDGRQMSANIQDKVVFRQPRSAEERAKVASACRSGLKIGMPILLDTMDNQADKAYSGWPLRLYVMGRDGKVAYKGRPGPRGFVPSELAEFLRKLLGPPEKEKEKSEGK